MKKKFLWKVLKSLLAIVMCVGVISWQGLVRVNAAAGDEPAHDKVVNDNGDGTYTIELSVTGDADTEIEEVGAVNVVIVYDTSSSMMPNTTPTRADQAEDVVYNFVHSLFGKQSSAHPENIEASLVSFAVSGSTREGWTSTENNILRYFDQGGTDNATNFKSVVGPNANSNNGVYSGSNSNGTNWQDALGHALELVNSLTDTDPTFVILLTDGAPTARAGATTINPSGATFAQLRPFYEAARENARSIATRANTTLFGIYAYGTEADLLDDLIYYANTGSDRDGYSSATVATENYYNASNTSALNQAVNDIFSKIAEALGIAQVAMSDGTTANVETSAGVATELLNVDDTSFRYWLTVPMQNNQFTRIDSLGNEITYTVTNNNDGTFTINWNGGSVTVNGELVSGALKYEWTESNALYEKAPPAAQFVDGAVDWDLKSVGTLLTGVTYSVTFEVWPSQTTLDLIADLKNGKIVYESGYENSLDENLKQWIKEIPAGSGNYLLVTNTTTSLTYEDTRTSDGPQETTFPVRDPVGTSSTEILAVSKEWINTPLRQKTAANRSDRNQRWRRYL